MAVPCPDLLEQAAQDQAARPAAAAARVVAFRAYGRAAVWLGLGRTGVPETHLSVNLVRIG